MPAACSIAASRLRALNMRSLDGVARDTDDLRDLCNRLFMKIDEIDDLAMLPRESREAFPQHRTRLLALEGAGRIVRRILYGVRSALVQLLFRAALERREGLQTGDPQEPGRDRGASFKLIGTTPHLEKHVADHVLGESPVAENAQSESIHPHVMAGIKHVHGRAVIVHDARHQRFVGDRLRRSR